MNTINTSVGSLPLSGNSSNTSSIGNGISSNASWFSPDIDPSKSISATDGLANESMSIDQLADQILSHISLT